jgi:LytS/YehU family sensor histidine kinase
MIIQPFVENSIWHGIANLDEAEGLISIVFKLHSPVLLQITIEDTGIGIRNSMNINRSGKQHLKLGMAITRKRLMLLGQKYGIVTSIVYSEKYPGRKNPGTCATIIVPFFYSKSESQQNAART